jgi:hypothetical protein
MKPESTTIMVSDIELVSKRDTEEADGTGEVPQRRPEPAIRAAWPEGNPGC